MTKYETLLHEAHMLGINVLEVDVCTNKDYGLYLDNIIIINRNMNETQKYCVLAEEISHHLTNYGDITELTKLENIREECKARRVACEKVISPNNIIKALSKGITCSHELAEELHITESFLKEALQYYKNKYGVYFVGDTHILVFEPLRIVEVS